jgi:cysteine desulfurase/selenocysteine lyase
MGLDVASVRSDFPLLAERVHEHPIVYLDNAATSQKPRPVLEALRHYYEHDNANIHRGVHELSQRATHAYEDARVTAQRFLGAAEAREIVFVRGSTEGVNLVAQTHGRRNVGPGDEVVISGMEHHSNIVPWQLLCEERGARLVVIPVADNGDLRLEEFERLLTDRTRLVAVVHVSNAIGTVNPIADIVRIAHGHGVPVLVDGAQAAPHLPIDVGALDCDFYVCSGHKVFGPTGIGILYGKAALLEAMPPYQGGGDMISSVTFARTTYNVLPHKFEAGTPHIAGVIGLGAALTYAAGLGHEAVAKHEADLLAHATEAVAGLPGVRILGTTAHKVAVLSFVFQGVHAHDVGTVLDRDGIAVRTGHHCCQPLMDRFGVPATVRASFAPYNTHDEIDRLAAALTKAQRRLG